MVHTQIFCTMTCVVNGTYMNISDNELCSKWYIYKYFLE